MITLICLTYNEENYIQELISSLSSFDPKDKKVIIVDGGSNDDTLSIADRYIKKNSLEDVTIIHNPDRYVSNGFNKAYSISDSKYIALIGAHTQYPKNYLIDGIKFLEMNKCDAIGGPLKHIGYGRIGGAIASCMSSIFGVGNVSWRVKDIEEYVDSVPFAIYKREVFENIGLLDTELIRNQDDEFNYRMIKNGYRILMSPKLKTKYVVRNSIIQLIKQYFQYGLYKPLVIKKVNNGIHIRHLIPACFCLYILSLIFIHSIIGHIAFCPLVLYTFLSIVFSFKDYRSIVNSLLRIIIFPVIHLSYGLGTLTGIAKLFRV